jgi:CRP-like cAMP-binding protein
MSDPVKLFAEGLFKGFAPDEMDAFLRRCQEKTYKDGTSLFMEETEATKLYLILQGGIALHFEMPKRENANTNIVTRKSGDAVGWSAIVPPYRYRLSGYCKDETTLLEIDRESLTLLFEANYHLAYVFMRNISVLTGERLHQVQDKLAQTLVNEAVNGW